jgi:hypothetical protein
VLFRFVPAFGAVWEVPFLAPGFRTDPMFLAVYMSWLAVAYGTPTLLSNGRMRLTLHNAFTLLRAGPALAAIWRDCIRSRVRFDVTPKGAGARAPLAAYGFPVAGVVIGGSAAIMAIGQLFMKRAYGLLIVSFFNVEFLMFSLLALWIVRERAVSRDVDSVVVQRPGMMLIDGDHDNKVSLAIVRLGAARAISVGPPGLHGETGVLRLTLNDGEYHLRGMLRCLPNRIVPRIKTQGACYDFTFALSGQDHDRLADQIDGQEVWRFFRSLRNYPYKLPPQGDRFDYGMVYYPLRPRTPSFRF